MDIEVLRATSAIGVVAVHAAAGAVVRGPQKSGDAGYSLAVVFDYLGHAAVPIFFAIAGWVLLAGRPVDSEKDLNARLARIAIPFAVWSAVYALWGARESSLSDALGALPAMLLGTPTATHLWFLYPYLVLLALLGVITLILAGKALTRASAAVLALGVLTACVPWAASVLAPRLGIELTAQHWGLSISWILCAIAGGLLLRSSAPFGRYVRLAAGVSLVVLTAAALAACYAFGYGPVLAAAGPLVLLAALAFLVAGRGLTVPTRLHGPVLSLARASFGVYLVHMLVLQALIFLLAQVSPLLGGAKPWWSIPLLTASTVLVSWALAAGWTRLRLSRVLG